LTTTSFSDVYSGGVAAVSIPEGVYDVRVSDARPGKDESRTIFITLEVLNGPAAGKSTDVNLYVPEIGSRAVFYYQKKTAGFAGPEFKAALDALGPDPAIGDLLLGIANFLIGRTVTAEISLQKGGQYDGQNQLDNTKPSGVSPTAASPQITPEVPVPAPQNSPAVAEANGAVAAQTTEVPPF